MTLSLAAPPEAIDTKFDFQLLTPGNVTETGEPISVMDGIGTLSRIPSTESVEWNMDLDLLNANPKQPRKTFRRDELEELKGTLKTEGQKVTIIAVPYKNHKGEIKLMIVDGERRSIALRELGHKTARVVVRWYKTAEEIFFVSLISNLGRAGYNEIDLAEDYETAIEFLTRKGVTAEAAILDVATRMGIKPQQIRQYLKLLDLSDDMKELVRKEGLPPASALSLGQNKRRYGNKFDAVKAARALLDSLKATGDITAARNNPKVTAQATRIAIQNALLEGGEKGKKQVAELQAATALYGLKAGISRIRRSGERFMEVDGDASKKLLRARTEPPEILRDQIDKTIEILQRIRGLALKAISPDPLPEIADKPKFSAYITKQSKNFGSELRYRMACALAKESEKNNGDIMSVQQLCETLNADTNSITSNLRHLQAELALIDINLQEHTIREKDSRNDYKKKSAYRLSWKQEKQIGQPAVVKSPPVPTSVRSTTVPIRQTTAITRPVSAETPRTANQIATTEYKLSPRTADIMKKYKDSIFQRIDKHKGLIPGQKRVLVINGHGLGEELTFEPGELVEIKKPGQAVPIPPTRITPKVLTKTELEPPPNSGGLKALLTRLLEGRKKPEKLSEAIYGIKKGFNEYETIADSEIAIVVSGDELYEPLKKLLKVDPYQVLIRIIGMDGPDAYKVVSRKALKEVSRTENSTKPAPTPAVPKLNSGSITYRIPEEALARNPSFRGLELTIIPESDPDYKDMARAVRLHLDKGAVLVRSVKGAYGKVKMEDLKATNKL